MEYTEGKGITHVMHKWRKVDEGGWDREFNHM